MTHTASSPEWPNCCQVDFANSGTPADQLLQYAKDNLRCIDWQVIKEHDIMRDSGKRITTATGATQVESAYSLSRPVRAGERIDYFMSQRCCGVWVPCHVGGAGCSSAVTLPINLWQLAR